MALSKIQTGLVDTNVIGATELNLADNFAFTGNVTGAGKIVAVHRGTAGNESTGTFQTSNNTYLDTTINCTFTKVQTNSYIVGTIIQSFGSDFTATKWIANTKMMYGSSMVTDTMDGTNGYFVHYGDDQNHRRDYYIYTTQHIYHNLSSSGSVTYDWYIKGSHSSSGPIRGGGIRWLLYEIAN
ncbi:hypothetical protein Melnitz3EXVC039M_177 [Methylophilales phage Melnitz-3 EXVC039M]|nr:hypothetical protein Melnitz3EXVC039M_177 [Methylophilales phage Melnitz-3 EXVC039M]